MVKKMALTISVVLTMTVAATTMTTT